MFLNVSKMNKWALIGQDIDYSLSPLIHNYLNQKYQEDANYQICNTETFSEQVLSDYQCGNITIPHKHAAYQFAGASNFSDQSINTFKKVGDVYHFMSTDQFGIIDTIQKMHVKYIETRLHVIFGDGATSMMLASVLQNEFNVPADKIYIISRKNFDIKQKPSIIDYKYFKKFLKANYVLYNTTPLGSADKADISPFTNNEVAKALAIFDVTYNPTYNRLGKQAYANRVKYINGLNMLIVQAFHSYKFWTGRNVMNNYGEVKRYLHFENCSKLVICAMPFAGKSTLFKRNRDHSCDLDSDIEAYTKQKNSEYINNNGIDAFRKVEAEVLASKLNDDDVKVIYLGGGTLTNAEAINHLSNELVIYMVVSLKTLRARFDKSRANIQSIEQLEQLYYERDRHYRNISKFQIGARNIERIINEYMDY